MNIRRRKHCCRCRRSTSVLLLKTTSTTRQTEQVEERSKEINPLHPKSHPTNLPTLQSAYSNRPTGTPRRKRSKRSSSRRTQQVATNRMPETALLLQCPHTYHHMPSSIIPRAQQRPTQLANHQQIKQHHNHQSTTHPPPHHHRHHPSSTIHQQQQPPFSPGQQQPTGEQHRASPRFSKRSPHTSKKSPSVAKRICRFSAAAPSAQCIESPRGHLILDNKPHTHAPRVEGYKQLLDSSHRRR